METHVDKGGSLGHELTAHREDQVGAVTAFVFLHFGGLSDHLGGRVVHIRFLDDGVSVRGDKELLQVVDDHLVHACKERQRCEYSGKSFLIYLPPGPRAVRVILARP